MLKNRISFQFKSKWSKIRV